jgi:hypothetical protein
MLRQVCTCGGYQFLYVPVLPVGVWCCRRRFCSHCRLQASAASALEPCHALKILGSQTHGSSTLLLLWCCLCCTSECTIKQGSSGS